jgi:divalent metal cation (Fe/Co/Zn/Cd) transporter
MDASPDNTLTDRVRAMAATTEGVAAIEKCLIRKMGGRYFVDMHVEVDPQMTVVRAHEIAHEVKDRVREKLPQIQDVLVHIEPAGHEAKGD